MATLEGQYKRYMESNPDSTFTYDDWLKWFGERLLTASENYKNRLNPNSKRNEYRAPEGLWGVAISYTYIKEDGTMVQWGYYYFDEIKDFISLFGSKISKQQQAMMADPTAQVLLKTQMAETQRKQQEFQTRMQQELQQNNTKLIIASNINNNINNTTISIIYIIIYPLFIKRIGSFCPRSSLLFS